MRMLFRQRFFSWFDSYDIYGENGESLFTVKGQLSWGHRLNIYDAAGVPVGSVRERVLTLLPQFELYAGERCVGCIKREFSLFTPRYDVDCMGWRVEGNFLEWDYTVLDDRGGCAATVSKQLFNLTDTYVIDVARPEDALPMLMLVLAIDAEKCSRG